MITTPPNKQALLGLRPSEVAAYLRAGGWAQKESIPDKGGVWERRVNGETVEVLLPTNQALRDYLPRLAEAVQTLSVVEGRPAPQVLADVISASADVSRVSVEGADVGDGTIPLPQGVELFQHAQDMMLAAACAAVQPKANYGPRKPDQAGEYARQLRLGQTERGSYAASILSRVPPLLGPREGGPPVPEMEEPFGRRVVTTLYQALAALRSAAEEATATGRRDALEASVKAGVSANLCQALVGMTRHGDAHRNLHVTVSYSRVRPTGAEMRRQVNLPGDLMPVIAEAARVFRETSPTEDFELVGVVTRLERPKGAETGRVTVLGFIDGQPRQVTVDLGGAEYDLAIRAHKDRAPIHCLGDLRKNGRGYVLRGPRRFELGPAE